MNSDLMIDKIMYITHNEDSFKIDGVKVDINPIKAEKTGMLETYFPKAEKYLTEKKKALHVFIPHNEIKEVDLWLSESATLVRDKEWQDAISKIEVLKELTEQIPKTFRLSWENLF